MKNILWLPEQVPQTAGIPVTLSATVSPSFTSPDVRSNEEYLVFRLTVTDNQGLQNTSHCVICLTDAVFEDTDGDSMADNWEREYFGTLDRNGTADNDGDGFYDLYEYLKGLNPTTDTRGDINQNGQIDLADAIIALKIASDIDVDTLVFKADINEYGKIGLEDAIYVLQHIAE